MWESFRTVDSISPVFGGKSPALSIELLFNADKTLKEVKIVDRVKSITTKYDSSGKLVMDEWLLKHPECTEIAKVYEKKLGILLEHNYLIKKPPIPEPQKEVQEPSVVESPKQAFQPHAIKTETPTPVPREALITRTRNLTPHKSITEELIEAREAVGERNRKIAELFAANGADIKSFPIYVWTCTPSKVEKIMHSCDQHNFDWRLHSEVFKFKYEHLDPNLALCNYNDADPVKLRLVGKLHLPHEQFSKFLRDRMTAMDLEFKELPPQSQ